MFQSDTQRDSDIDRIIASRDFNVPHCSCITAVVAEIAKKIGAIYGVDNTYRRPRMLTAAA
jgi:hypothetical protein